MKKGINLSDKHGVNPTLGVCFWCGEEDGTIGLLGKLPNDEEAPRKAIISMEPCKDCVMKMALGITLIESSEDRIPTGRWLVVREKVISELVNDSEIVASAMKHRKLYIEPAIFEFLKP